MVSSFVYLPQDSNKINYFPIGIPFSYSIVLLVLQKHSGHSTVLQFFLWQLFLTAFSPSASKTVWALFTLCQNHSADAILSVYSLFKSVYTCMVKITYYFLNNPCMAAFFLLVLQNHSGPSAKCLTQYLNIFLMWPRVYPFTTNMIIISLDSFIHKVYTHFHLSLCSPLSICILPFTW